MTPSLPRLLSFPLLLILLSACGSGYETVKIKDYRIAVLAEDPAVHREFENLIHDFNYYAGIDALRYVTDPKEANSAVFLTKDLRKNSPKNYIGLGQWIADTDEDDAVLTRPGEKRRRVIRYSMRIELDEDYFRERMNADDDERKRREKQILFFHEVGHGMEMNHHPNRIDVMYEDVSGQKDFGTFFERVSSYMEDRD